MPVTCSDPCCPPLPALALLLALRLGRVYDRWWMARRKMAATGNTAIELVQQAGAWMEEKDQVCGQALWRLRRLRGSTRLAHRMQHPAACLLPAQHGFCPTLARRRRC